MHFAVSLESILFLFLVFFLFFAFFVIDYDVVFFVVFGFFADREVLLLSHHRIPTQINPIKVIMHLTQPQVTLPPTMITTLIALPPIHHHTRIVLILGGFDALNDGIPVAEGAVIYVDVEFAAGGATAFGVDGGRYYFV